MMACYQKTVLNMFKMSIVILLCSLSSATNVCFRGDFPGSTMNRKLTQSTFLVYNSTGLVDCVRYCSFHIVCLSVNFNTVTNECELNGPVTGTLEEENSFLHVEISHVPAAVLGLCGGHGCDAKERCQPSDDFGYTCVPVGCIGSPRIANVNDSSFYKAALWPFGKTVEYACANGFYPSANAVCQENGTWNYFECHSFETCDDLLKCGRPPNGEFWLEFFPGFQKIKIFCFLSSTKGYSFSTLTKPNYSIMASNIRVSNTSCQSRFQIPPYSYKSSGSTQFHKIFIYRPGRFIQIDKLAYAESIGTAQQLATAGDCFTINDLCEMKGSFVFDLRGTGLKMRDGVNWKVQGILAKMNISKAPDGLQVSGTCGGYCGYCLREDKIFFERDPTYVPPPVESATVPTCPTRI